MWGWRRWRRISFSTISSFSSSSLLPQQQQQQPLLLSSPIRSTIHAIPQSPKPISTSVPQFSHPCSSSSSSSSSTSTPHSVPSSSGGVDFHDDEDGDRDEEDGFGVSGPVEKDDNLAKDVDRVMITLRDFGADGAEAKLRLEQCGVVPSSDLVSEVLSRLRNDWSAAFTFFLCAGKQPGYAHSAREYHSMISILGKMRRFDTAWSLINEMRGGFPPSRAEQSLVTPQTLMILIRRYCAAHEVAKAISAFYALKKYGFTPGVEDFHGLLSALSRYKNVEDAEHLLLCNEKVFPFETKSFNIVLNGWCNVLVVVREAKRFWRSMEKRGIPQDVVSYGCMMSCFSKAGNLNDVMKLFDRMKGLGIDPDRKVYNAVMYALAKSKCIKEAKDVFKTMEEKGIAPNAVTFNSLIRPLCKAERIEEAREVFDDMLRRGISPSIRTFHAFFAKLRTTEEVFELLGTMKYSGCGQQIDTYIMLIRKLCRWRQFEKVFELWDDICMNGPSPDRSAYIVLIHGLFLNGKLDEAHKYYEEMKTRGFSPEPRTDEMIQAWLTGKETAGGSRLAGLEGKQIAWDAVGKIARDSSNTSKTHRNHLKPEIRNVSRERGFSLW